MDFKKMVLIMTAIVVMFGTTIAIAEELSIGYVDFNGDGIKDKAKIIIGLNKKYGHYTNMVIIDGKTKNNLFLPINKRMGNVPAFGEMPRIIGKYIYYPTGRLNYEQSEIDFFIYGYDAECGYVCPLYTKKIVVNYKTTNWNQAFEIARKAPAQPFYYYRTLLRALYYGSKGENEKLQQLLNIQGIMGMNGPPLEIFKNTPISSIKYIIASFDQYEKKIIIITKSSSFWVKFNEGGNKIEMIEYNREYDIPK